MNKPHQIRKKAVEFAKKRQWDKAVNEYIRLAEMEANNPNVHNELGDLHLKTGNKSAAFKAFHAAIDAYGGMGLYNNAVAVCKKIVRLNPSDCDVFRKLAKLRIQQGIKKEASTYALAYLNKLATDMTVDVDETRKYVVELSVDMSHVPEVLEKVVDYFVAQQLEQDTGEVLERLAHAYASLGRGEEAKQTVDRMDAIGYTPSAPVPDVGAADTPATVETPVAADAPAAEAPTDTEYGDFSIPLPQDMGGPAPSTAPAGGDHYDFDSVELGSSPASGQATATEIREPERIEIPDVETPSSPGSPGNTELPEAPAPMNQASPDIGVAIETDRFDLPAGEVENPSDARAEPPAADPPLSPADDTPGGEVVDDAIQPADDGIYDIPAEPTEYVIDDETPAAEPVDTQGEAFVPDGAHIDGDLAEEPASAHAAGEVWIPQEDLPSGVESRVEGDGGVVKVSDLVEHFSAEVTADVDADDFRSHYDLGMAYLEMDLITEAIREFQFAANSSHFQTRSLELIGLCFIKQNQPRLAVKQLEKGLALVGGVDRDSIGLQYNLGLAFEMMDMDDRAKHCFEEVYVLDVSFREVAEKIKKYTS